MNKAQINAGRRTFLAAAVCAPALAVGALLTRQQGLETALPSLPDNIPTSVGYHETEHIREYYRTAAYL